MIVSGRGTGIGIVQAQPQEGQDAAHRLARLVAKTGLDKIEGTQSSQHLFVVNAKLPAQYGLQLVTIVDRIEHMPQPVQRFLLE